MNIDMMHLFSGKGLSALRQAVDDCFASQQGGAWHVMIDSLDHLLQHATLAEASNACITCWLVAFHAPYSANTNRLTSNLD